MEQNYHFFEELHILEYIRNIYKIEIYIKRLLIWFKIIAKLNVRDDKKLGNAGSARTKREKKIKKKKRKQREKYREKVNEEAEGEKKEERGKKTSSIKIVDQSGRR